MKSKSRDLVLGALIGAMYAALCYLQNMLIPGSTSWAIQFRAAEALCVLALVHPAAIGGLSVGCLLYNLTWAGALPLDPVLGTAATALAAAGMYLTRGLRLGDVPWLALCLPALTNGLLVGWELTMYLGGGFWLNCLYVALGELGVLLSLGLLLWQVVKTPRMRKYLSR